MIELKYDGVSKPLAAPRLRVLSLGAGVQSTTLALMAARGELPEPLDCAIFADTMAEPSAVYRHLDWLEKQLPFPVHRVSAGDLRQEILDAAAGIRGAWGRPPLFVKNVKTGRVGMTNRQCTQDYKLEPITKKVRELIGLRKGLSIRNFLRLKKAEKVPHLVEQWIGISTDEIQRVKDSRHAYIWNRHPLIEARMSRMACLQWLEERQYPRPPKSACTFCPFHSQEMWADMVTNDPESFEDACTVDEALRREARHIGLKGELYIHRSCTPLRTADLSPSQGFDPLGITNECDGVCML